MIANFIKKVISFRQFPKEISLEVTGRCNLNCQFCFNKAYIRERDVAKTLSTQQIKVIIDKISDSPASIVRFTGGEPLLREDIIDLMRYAQEKGLEVWLNTNATLIGAEKAKAIAKYAKNVLVSLNSYDLATESQISGDNVFKRKLKGIKYLQKFKVPYIRCGTVASKENIMNLGKIFSLVKRLKISNWEIFREMPLSGQDSNVKREDITELVDKLIRINECEDKRYLVTNAIPFCASDPKKVSKVAIGAIEDDGHSRFTIDFLGRGKPMYYLDEFLGDIFRTNISKMWQTKFMRDMRNLKFIPDVCKRCQYVQTCKGGSRSAAKALYGDYTKADPLAQPDFVESARYHKL